MSDTLEEDLELLRAFQAGESRAGDLLYEKYVVLGHSCLMKRGMGYHDAEDIVQDVMAKLFVKKFVGFDSEKGTLKTYIFRCMTHKSIDGHRHKNGTVRFAAGEAEEIVDQNETAEQALESLELSERIQDALEKLDPDQRELFLLNADFSILEISEQLGKTYGSVAMLIHKARRRLAEVLALELPATKRGRPRKQPVA